jgi:hypothetical protein
MYTHARSKYKAVAIDTAQTEPIALRLIPSAKKNETGHPCCKYLENKHIISSPQ